MTHCTIWRWRERIQAKFFFYDEVDKLSHPLCCAAEGLFGLTLLKAARERSFELANTGCAGFGREALSERRS
jgi:hypothetical protein